MSYCTALATMSPERLAIHQPYHDRAYGFPIADDNELFCRLILEINQAGLSWETVLKKEATFRQAYRGFDLQAVAAFTEADRQRLMADPGVIRNRLKIEAAIDNAKTVLALQQTHGSFARWLASQHPTTKEDWVKLFRKTFRFTGGEIVGEFLMSIGYLPGAHDEACPIYQKALQKLPAWSAPNASK